MFAHDNSETLTAVMFQLLYGCVSCFTMFETLEDLASEFLNLLTGTLELVTGF